MKSTVLIIIFFISSFSSIQSQVISGRVVDAEENPLPQATVLWQGTSIGTVTNLEGFFEISTEGIQNKILIVSYVGFQNDTIFVGNQTHLDIMLQASELQSVEVTASDQLNNEVNQIETLTTLDLRKAACCNLSESFETNASVDVSFSDAVSGTKRIRMLGLDGVYAQIMTENIPSVRGLASRSGLHFIPGTWIQAIDISKGAGSVVNGYESISGQINLTLASLNSNEKMLLNFYTNQMGRVEGNLNLRHSLSEKWHTSLLLHGSFLNTAPDNNKDGFRDIPDFQLVNVANRWLYDGENIKWHAGFSFVYDDKIAGQNDFSRKTSIRTNNSYGLGQITRRAQAWSKLGLLPEKHQNQSLGIISSVLYHEHEAFWGIREYQAIQNYGLLQLIYQNELNEKHTLKAGVSLVMDSYEETLQNLDTQENLYQNRREEWVTGTFAEYTWKASDKFNLIAGLRFDKHNLYGDFWTPRLHLKYSPTLETTIRLSGGRGFRVANVLVENGNYLASSRTLTIQNDLQPEIAWNYGGSFSQGFYLNSRKGNIVIDFYRTDFENQVVMDLDASSQSLLFYNLSGNAFANSFQSTLTYEVFERFDMTLAYKYYDVKTTFNGRLRTTPFVPQDRVLVNLAYATNFEKWQFDFTTQWLGKQRIPSVVESNLDEYSPTYFLFNAQITKRFKGGWDVYIGGENLGNYRQDNPVRNPENPFGDNFDAGLVYAPVLGRMIYAGVRWEID